MKAVHIGFPKTAVTFLQQRVFPRLAPPYGYFGKEASRPYFADLMNRDDSVFDLEAARRRFEDVWRAREDVLFSYEPLTGLHHGTAFVNRTLIARRLAACGFERVVITIRNQFDVLESAYKQFIKSGGTLPFADYVTFDSSRAPYLYPEYFDYYAAWRLYAQEFGAENVLILQYEHMHEPRFLDELCRFLGVEPFTVAFEPRPNASLSVGRTRLLRILNHFTYSAHRPSHLVSRKISTRFLHRQLARLPSLGARGSFLDSAARQAVVSFYAASNEALRERAGVSLADTYP